MRNLALTERDYFQYIENFTLMEKEENNITSEEELDNIRLKRMKNYSYEEWYNDTMDTYNNHTEDDIVHYPTYTHDVEKYRLLQSKIAE